MINPRLIINSGLLLSALLLSGCGGSSDSGGTTPAEPTTNISGKAEAPGGAVAQFSENKSILVATTELMFTPAYAGITGLQPVTGATVELIRIDDDGNQIGAVLASTVTSITGDYNLALPSGVSLAGDLIVRISGNGGATMSAMVVDQAVDISPISQFVLDKFVNDETLVLANLATNEVVALRGKVEEFDLTATADLSTMLSQLEAEVGDFVDNEIAVIEATPDDGTAANAVAGNWRTVEFSLGMHDSDPDTSGNLFGSFAMDIFSEELAVADAGNGTLTITIGQSLLNAFTNYNSDNLNNTSIYHEISLGDAGDSFSAGIDADSNISIAFPFEEDLQTVDVGGANDPEGDGPDLGWRYPPGSLALKPVANANTYVSILTDAGVRYGTTDTDGDTINDAIDPNARQGDEVFMSLFLLLKAGSGMSTASLDGDYGLTTFNVNLDTAPVAIYDSAVGVINFTSGTASFASNALDVKEVTRTPTSFPAVTLSAASFMDPAIAENFPYTVTADGQVTLDFAGDGSDLLEGYSNSDGSVVAFVDDVATGSPDVTNVNDEMVVAVKLGSAMSNALDGASYRLYPLSLELDESGSSALASLKGSITFNADSTSATISGDDRGVERSTDVAEVTAIISEANPAPNVFTVDSVAANGAVSMSDTDGVYTDSMKGFVSADGNMLVLRFYGDGASNGYQDIGIVVGVKQ